MEHKSRNELMALIKRHGLTSKVERKEKDEALAQAYDHRTAKEDYERKYNDISQKYTKLLSDHEILQKAAQKANELPKAKVIPLSNLASLPLMGQKMISVLIPFLKKYNIVIDERK